MNKDQIKSINKAYDYMLKILITQERVLPKNEIYGDGSMFKDFTLEGFNELYETLLEALKETGHLKKEFNSPI